MPVQSDVHFPSHHTTATRWARGGRASMERRIGSLPVWVLLIQLFIGLGWVRAAVEKAIDPHWWSGGELEAFLQAKRAETVGWYQPFVDVVVEPNLALIATIVFVLQLVAGTLLLLGRRIALALGVGMFLNLHFVAVGEVTPSVFYLLAQGTVVTWLIEQGRHCVSRRLRATAIAAAAMAASSLPFVATVHPDEVVHDPALMLATAGALTVMACELLQRRADTALRVS